MNKPADHSMIDSSEEQSTAFEQEFGRDLEDAFDVPPVPVSLEKRLDKLVDIEWGNAEPPSVSVNHIQKLLDATSSVLARRSIPARLALCFTIAIGLFLVLQGDGTAYGWASVYRAIQGQTVVLVQEKGQPGLHRWFSVEEELWGEQTTTRRRVIDMREGMILQSGQDESSVQRIRFNNHDAIQRSDYRVLSSLTGINVSPDYQISDERWEKKTEVIALSFKVASGSDRFNVHLDLNPETHLPLLAEVQFTGEKRRELKFSYTEQAPREVLESVIGQDATIVDIEPAAQRDFNMEVNTLAAVTDQVDETVKQSSDRITEGAASLGWEPVAALELAESATIAKIDSTLDELWKDNQIVPVSVATDEELLRRIYIDLTGRTPTVNEVRNYLNDTSENRYESLVEKLLASRDHATHLATMWRNFLIPEGVDLSKFGGVAAFDTWLSGKFEENTPYDQLVRELLLAEGRLSKSGPLLFYSSLKLDADQLAARTARVFLGMRLDCAQCHDDPFEPWTQKDFWSYAAFFAQISRPNAELETVSTVMQVRDVNRGEVMIPFTEAPVSPRFLDGRGYDSNQESGRRKNLAKWLTSSDNPYFARAAANRVWAIMFGKGIVDPVDGFGKQHPATSPELLDLLAGTFIQNDFSLQDLFRKVALSKAYRLSSGAEDVSPKRQKFFAQMNVKTFTAEQVYDSISVATMLNGAPSSGYAVDRFGDAGRAEFLTQFKTSSGKVTEYQGGIPQSLTLMNGTLINSATGLSSSGLLKSLDAPFFSDEERVEVLYLATLSRKPTNQEWKTLKNYLSDRPAGVSVQEPLADILWALLNSAEFTMNH